MKQTIYSTELLRADTGAYWCKTLLFFHTME